MKRSELGHRIADAFPRGAADHPRIQGVYRSYLQGENREVIPKGANFVAVGAGRIPIRMESILSDGSISIYGIVRLFSSAGGERTSSPHITRLPG
jgi:hypothetical protein